jgi:hypothetical protein
VDAHTFTIKTEKFKQILSARKLMTSMFWEKKGGLMVEFMQQGAKITSKVYCETLKNCIGPFRIKGVEC